MQKKLMFFVKDFIVGGVEQVLVTTLNELSAQGYEILVVWSGYLEKNHLYKKINPSIKQLDTNDIWHLVDENKPKSGLKKLVYFFKKNLNLYLLRNIIKFGSTLIKVAQEYKKRHPIFYKIWKHLGKKLRKKGIIQ